MSRWIFPAAALLLTIAMVVLLWQVRGGGGGGPSRPDPAARPQYDTPVGNPGDRPELGPPGHVAVADEDGEAHAPIERRVESAREYDEAEDRRIDEAVARVEELFASGDHEDARVAAHRVLVSLPGDERMIAIVVESACELGIDKEARQYYAELAGSARERVAERCRARGIDLD